MPACLIQRLDGRRHRVVDEQIGSAQFPRIHRRFRVKAFGVLRPAWHEAGDPAFPPFRCEACVRPDSALSGNKPFPVRCNTSAEGGHRTKSGYDNRFLHRAPFLCIYTSLAYKKIKAIPPGGFLLLRQMPANPKIGLHVLVRKTFREPGSGPLPLEQEAIQQDVALLSEFANARVPNFTRDTSHEPLSIEEIKVPDQAGPIHEHPLRQSRNGLVRVEANGREQ
ncbi:hypothetical protein CHELA1G11_12610 [Hyphomicrobiales bacterium]|nr:hypothetical protein CHELA1G2_11698 [Hyphomicrobiales bacterium]CAH1665909.1 hypothetical protein CHELA1G11_12610 [Hyphomicrobiales bacterium]